MQPALFGGFTQLESGAKLAEPEKALVDLLYLSSNRTRLFAALPEVTIPKGFRWSRARDWARQIPSVPSRGRALRLLEGHRASLSPSARISRR